MPVAKTYTTYFDGHLDHPDTQRLAAALELLGLPRRWRDWVGNVAPLLNLYCLHNQEDGDLTHLPAERIAQICRWPIPSKAEEFVGALKCAGVLEEQEQPGGGVRYVVHNFGYYCRRLLNERKRKRNARRQSDAALAARTTPVRDVSAPASVDELAPIVIGTVNGNVKDRERPLTAVQAGGGIQDQIARGDKFILVTEQQPIAAGASRPKSETLSDKTAGNDKGPTPELTTANPAPDWDPPRPEDVQSCLSTLAELLRRWGWVETSTRRFLKWLIGWKRGEWVRRACEGDYWKILGFAKQIEERQARGLEVKDAVSLLIHMLDKGYQPNEQNYRLAKTAWIHVDGEGERVEPIWMREVLQAIGAQGGAK